MTLSAIAKPIAQSAAHPMVRPATPPDDTKVPPAPRALADAGASPSEAIQRLESRSGASLELAREGASERLRVRDGSGTLIFEHDPESGRSTLCVAGDLSLQTGGHLDLVAAKGVRVMSPGPVAIESATHLSAGVTGGSGSRSSGPRFAGMRALPGGLMITGRRLEAVAARANLTFERLQARGKQWDATAERVKLTAVRLETVAERVLRRAQNVYDHVDELKQERLGRLRTLVRDAIDFRGKTATFITEGETRIDGERIHLG